MLHSILKDPTGAVGGEPKSTAYRHSCGSADVRHTHRKSLLILFAKKLGYDAFRCRACGKRFFKRAA